MREVGQAGCANSDGLVEVEDGAEINLELEASDHVGNVRGFVKDGDKPVPGVDALLVPKFATSDYHDIHAFQTDSDGSFDFKNIRAGEYSLLAVSATSLEYAKADALKPYLPQARVVKVERRKTISETIPLSPVP